MTDDKIKGGLYGLLIGDALGVPYEFTDPANIPDRKLIEMLPPKQFPRAHASVPIGTWSDDGAQALVLLHSLINQKGLLVEAFQNGLWNWFHHGFMTPDGNVFDVGIQTQMAIMNFADVPNDEFTNGNGSLMRSLPIALYFRNSPHIDQVLYPAMTQSRVTHPHLKSQLTCALYNLMALELLKGSDINEALSSARVNLAQRAWTNHWEESLDEIDAFESQVHSGSGYVLDCFWTAIDVIRATDSYEDAVKRAIEYGNDTDTTACVVGGLAGIIYGYDAIPQRWTDVLNGKDLVEPLLEKLLNG